MQPPLVGTLGASPFASASVPSEAMIWWAMGYVVVALLWGLWQFNQRDL
jgi:hypothetical protein